ncbi:MAG: helix-turn-helix domain-containing protein [Aestuariivirga sp.]|jgi:DNA-binding HxlR family transcriptional regulator
MSEHGSYGQFCPVAMAAEIFCSRWTPLILREMVAGTRRFNDLRRGVPRMSPTLLSKRLMELRETGIIEEVATKKGGKEYQLTPAGEDLKPIVMALGFWGQRWVESKLSLKNLDPSLLMWDMRRWLDPKPLPKRRCTITYHFIDTEPARQHYWLVVETDGTVDLCNADPGFEVDLFITGSLRAMTAIWMGVTTVKQEVEARELDIQGDKALARDMQEWLGLSPFAKEKSRLAA